MPHLSVNVLSTNWGNYFYVFYWRRDRSRRSLPSHARFQRSFFSYFKTVSIGPGLGTSLSADKRSTN